MFLMEKWAEVEAKVNQDHEILQQLLKGLQSAGIVNVSEESAGGILKPTAGGILAHGQMPRLR